jgi:DNA-binding NarL/FixJ family response regulator
MPRLLLLQNDATVGEHLRRALAAMPDMEVCGLTTTLAHALRSLSLGLPDLVLVDLQLRRGEFDAFLDELSNLGRDARPLVLVGALSLDAPALMEAIAQGADGYYLHGSSPEVLRNAILQVLAGESPMAPTIARQVKQLFDAPAWNGAGVAGDTRDALRLSEAQQRMLERIGEGFLAHEVAHELQTSEHEVGVGVRTLYRKLQLDRRAAAMAGQLN